MRAVTADEMRQLDRRAIEGGMSGTALMENAGRAVFDFVRARYGPLPGKSAAVFCGAGNNGGDGFVAVRLLTLAGCDVSLFTAFDPANAITKLKNDAAAHWTAMGSLSKDCWRPIAVAKVSGPRFDFAIDALLGTGLKDAPTGPYAEGIAAIVSLSCPIVAVDIPSGVSSDDGTVPGSAVHATHTITFAYPKVGMFLPPASELIGSLTVDNIGYPWETLSEHTAAMDTLRIVGCDPLNNSTGIACSDSLRRADGWQKLLQKRGADTNKGDYGHIGIVAGSRGMTGAPALAARAAQRSGAGLVTVLTPGSIQPVLAAKLDEQMTVPLNEVSGALCQSAFQTIADFAKRASAICLGPGLTTQTETVNLVHRLIREIDRPLVMDADGLNALALDNASAEVRASTHGAPLIFTPHPGEAARLLGWSIAEVQKDRISAVQNLAQRFHATVLLKGRFTLVADPSGLVLINTTGNPGMATGGMGDVLTGITGALIGRGAAMLRTQSKVLAVPLPWTVALAAHLHGIAGDASAAVRGHDCLTASDVIAHLPDAFDKLAPIA